MSVPYDSARRGERMGAGPEHLLRSGAERHLCAAGHRVRVQGVGPPEGAFPAEISTAFALQRAVAAAVKRAVDDDAFPIALAGNCNAAALGMLAGLGRRDLAVLWFDSHGDFNTPETTVGGFLDGMALAIATGRCWRQLMTQLPGFEPVDEARVILAGVRDLDPLEARLLERSNVTVLRPGGLGAGLTPALDRLHQRVRELYVHIDLDVLDPAAHGRANAFAAPGGLTVEEVIAVLRQTAERFRLRGAALTAYDPAFDDDGRVCAAGLQLLETLADLASAMDPQAEAARRES